MALNLNRDPSLVLLLRDSRSFHLINLGPQGDEVKKSNPFEWKQIKLLGICNGFLCISKVDHSRVALWNPFNGDHRLLDPHGGFSTPPPPCLNGFWYGERDNDRVLFRLVHSSEEPIEHAVGIYSWTSRNWRRLQAIEMPYYLDSTSKRGVFVHGRLHWIMRREWALDSAKVLVAFDFHANKFVEVDRLKNNIDNTLDMDLAVQGGHLFVITYGEKRGVHVWRMGEYASNGPWRRWFSIPNHPRDSGLVRPLDFSRHGGHQVLVAVGSERLCWYDSETGEYVADFDNNAMPSFIDAEICW